MNELKSDVNQKVTNHEKRISLLERKQIKHEKELAELKQSNEQTRNSILRLENTILTTNKEQKDLLDKLVDFHLETKKISLNNKGQIAAAAVGGGGILYFIIENIFK